MPDYDSKCEYVRANMGRIKDDVDKSFVMTANDPKRACKTYMKLQLISIVFITFFFSYTAQAEIELGNLEAPVTIIEYASLTCGYCVRFHREVLPLIKTFYIETGKVRYIYRDYPTDSAAIRGAVAMQCAGSEYNLKLHDALYNSVENWSQSEDVDVALINVAVSLGINRETFISCLNEQQQVLIVKTNKEDAIFNHDVTVTPTFFINDKVIHGIQEFDEMEVLIKDAMSR